MDFPAVRLNAHVLNMVFLADVIVYVHILILMMCFLWKRTCRPLQTYQNFF